MSDTIQPTAQDLTYNLAGHLQSLDDIQGDVLACRYYHVGHHRAAIRRALAAEAEVVRLRAELEEAR